MPLTFHEPAREIPVFGEYDVVVAGGGPAGFAAAVSAARAGAKTLLIEKFASLGGTVTASLMAKINGFRNQVEPNTLQTSCGIAEEVMLFLDKIGGVGERYMPENKVYYHDPAPGKLAFGYVIDPEKFKFAALSIAVDAGVELLFHTFLSDVICENGTVRGVIVRHLALPGCGEDSRDILDYLHGTYGDQIFISLMNQYTPMPQVMNDPNLGRKLTSKEYDELVDYAISIGITNGFIQDGETASQSYIPAFDGTGL